MDLWTRLLELEGWAREDEPARNEAEKRRDDPDAYDCALAIWEFDEPDFVRRQLAEGRVHANALAPRSHQPLLHLAVVKDRVETCRLLIDAGADIHAVLGGESYVVTAVSCSSSVGLLRLLLDAGVALPTGSIRRHPSILHLAVWRASEPLALELVDRGVEVDVFLELGKTFVWSMFECAVRRNLYDLAAAILRRHPPRTLAHLAGGDRVAELKALDGEPEPFYASCPEPPPFSRDRIRQLCDVLAGMRS
jgi:ankyrin repeat protein